jgi:hypothetical protein
MADDDIVTGSTPSTSPHPRRPATTIDLPAEEVTPSATPGDTDAPAPSAQTPPSNASHPRHGGFTPLLAAAIGGAIVGAATVCGLWYFGFVFARDVVNDSINDRLAKLESQPRSAAPAANQNVIAELAARIAKVETSTAANSGPSPTPRVTALESNVKGIGDTVTSLTSRHDEIRSQLDSVQKSLTELRNNAAQQKSTVDSSELEKVASRLSPLETAVQNVQQAVSARANTTDRAVRQALVASSLRDSVLRGAPFAAELAAFKATGGDAAAVTTLEPFAAQGVPPTDKLCAELVTLLPKVTSDPGAPAKPAGFLDRLQAGADRLVRIRPVGEVAGSDSKAILARVEAKVAKADVDGVLSELSQLSPQQRAPLETWIEKAKARQTALAAARDISTKSVGALAPQTTQ